VPDGDDPGTGTFTFTCTFTGRAVAASAFALALLCAAPREAVAGPSMNGVAGPEKGSQPPAPPPAPDAAAQKQMNTRESRSGIVLGLQFGWGAAGSSGYPNNASKINDPNYYSASDLLGGSGGTFLVMGALADYVNFGIWFGGGTFESKDWKSTGGGAGLRVDLFPLYVLVPKLRDLAVFGQFGLGSTKLEAKAGGYEPAVGVQSYLGAGVFYEWSLFRMLGGHVSGGPSLEYDAIYSLSAERHSLMVGGRFAFYGGP
jgi:hypothetical protein